jgi:hypothetical protein
MPRCTSLFVNRISIVVASTLAVAWLFTPCPAAAQVIDDEDVGYSTTGIFTESTTGGFNVDQYFETSNTAAAGANTATWSFSGITPGSYFVSATWVMDPNRTSAARYTVSDGGGVTVVDQRSGITFNDNQNATNTNNGWRNLTGGPLSITDGTVSVTVQDNSGGAGSGFLMVDAVRLTAYSTSAEPGVYYIDNVVGTGNGFSQTGAWTNVATEGNGQNYLDDIQFQTTANNGATASWNFTNLADAGDYRVAATWSPLSNRTTAANYTFTDGASSVVINQQVAPNDFTTVGPTAGTVPWENLTQVSITDGTFSVTASNSQAGQFLMADAVRLEWLPPEIAVTGNGNNVADGSSATAGNGTQFGTVITGAAPVARTFTISNSGTGSLLLSGATTSAAPFTVTTSPAGSVAAGGGTTSLGVTMSTGAIGSFAESVSFSTNDSDEGLYNFQVTGAVLDHADAEFVDSLGNTLTLDFGIVHSGSGVQSLDYAIENIPAALRAALDLDSIVELSDSANAFSTDASPFSNLASGSSQEFALYFNPSGLDPGFLSAQYQFNLSDENLPGATSQTLTLFVTAQLVPEVQTIASWVMLACAVCWFGARSVVLQGRNRMTASHAGCEG